MKKSNLLFILVLSAFFVFSCSSKDDNEELADTGWNGSSQGGDSGDSLPDAVTNDEDKTDTISDNNDSGTSDSETSDTAITDNDIMDNDITDSDDNTDTTPDLTDSQSDEDDTDPADDSQSDEDAADSADDSDTVITDTDTDTDSGDSEPDDDGDTSTPGTPAFPECSKNSGTPCILGNLIWSDINSKQPQNITWLEAEQHCKDLTEGGFEDWRMPTISELRTLVQNCKKTATGGLCKVTDECTASYSTANPQCYNIDLCTSTTNAFGIERCGDKTDGSYSKLGDASVYIWSSSEPDEDHDKAWYIYFKNTNILNQKKTLTGRIRCVHEIE